MPAHRSTRLTSSVLLRLGAVLLVAAGLLPGQPLLAAARPDATLPSGPEANGPPNAVDDNLAAFPGVSQQLYVLDNDTDPDFDALTITDVGYSAHGSTYNEFYWVDYEPIIGNPSSDTFTYTVSDGHGHHDTATVHVSIASTGTANTRFAVYAGPEDRSIWTVNPHGGATDPSGSGECNNALGLGIEEVNVFNSGFFERYNGFDNGLTLWVNGNQVTPVLPMTVTYNSLTSGPVTMSGVKVTVHYDGLPGSNTLRTRVLFANSSGSTKAITATVASNVGSDNATVIPGSSDGNQAFSTADRWVVTADNLTHPSRVVDTHVLYGPNSPTNTTTAAFNTTFVCDDDPVASTHGIRARFNLTIPTGKTQELLFFNQAHSDNTSSALTDAANLFNGTPLCCLAGMSGTELGQVVNWKLSGISISRLFLPLLRR